MKRKIILPVLSLLFVLMINGLTNAQTNCSAIIQANGPTRFCQGGSVVLIANSGVKYLWSPGGQTTQSITANASGSYSVVVTDGNGCSATASSQVTVDPVPPLTILQSGSLCTGGFVALAAYTGPVLGSGGNYTYQWSTGATTQYITVTAQGSYGVTVTGSNGCSSSAKVMVTGGLQINPPTITSSGPTTFCSGNSITLTATSGFGMYLWSTGATTQSITVNTSGVYTVAVYSTAGCSAKSNPITVTVLPKPSVTISTNGSNYNCNGSGSFTLTAVTTSAAVQFLWSNGATTQTITVTTGGTYTVTVNNGTGCSATASTVVTFNSIPPPIVSASGPTTFCQGGSVTLSAPAGYKNYQWSNGATTSSIQVTASGKYYVSIVNSAGCTSVSAVVAIVVNPVPQVYVYVKGNSNLCAGGTVTLVAYSATNVPVQYLWSDGETTQTINITTAGSYYVTVTNSQGCSTVSAPVVISGSSIIPPTISVIGSTKLCSGDSVVLTASSGYGGYYWSNGATTQSITVKSTGSYYVTVRNNSGCSANSQTVKVSVEARPYVTIVASGTNLCSGTVMLYAYSQNPTTTVYTYLWSNGATTQSITASAAGTYTVTVTGINGCSTTSAPVTVSGGGGTIQTPVITASGSTKLCSGDSVVLSAPSGYASYLWSNGATTPSIVVNRTGSYTVTVKTSSGCSATSAATQVNVEMRPIVTIKASNTNLCAGTVVIYAVISNNTAGTFLWSNGATTQSIVVSAAGTYSVTVTSPNGCSATASTVISGGGGTIQTPVITASGSTKLCTGDSVVLTASAGYAYYFWSNQATTRSIVVKASGTYTVTVKNSTGCYATSAATTVNVEQRPYVQIGASGTNLCTGTVTLTAYTTSAMNVTLLWSNGATTQTITVANAGTYYVTVTGSNGCSSTSNSITINGGTIQPPVISVSGSTRLCSGDSVILAASPGYGVYYWSNGATTPKIVVKTSGTYTVTVKNTSGCYATSQAIQITVDPKPYVYIKASTMTLCSGADTLVAVVYQPTGTYYNYKWSTGATTQRIFVTAAGTYTVTATSPNGCSATATITITGNGIQTPVITASGSTKLCAGDSVVLTASSGYSIYYWSNQATTQSIIVKTSGSYTVTVKNSAGCYATSAAMVVNVEQKPSVTIKATTLNLCSGPDTLTAIIGTNTPNYKLVWSTGATSQKIIVTSPGTYTVTVTTPTGCSTTASVTITGTGIQIPIITASGSTRLCAGDSVVLSASSGYSVYYWSNQATTPSIVVKTSGSYTVTVKNAAGCYATSSPMVVNVEQKPSVTIKATTLNLCSGADTLTAVVGTNTPNYKLVWSNGATSQKIIITTAGTYTVTVTSGTGCSSTATIVINGSGINIPVITASGSTKLCSGDSVVLTASSGYWLYFWSNQATTQSITVKASGSYYVTVKSTSGCYAQSATVVVNVEQKPSVTIKATTLNLCSGADTLTAIVGPATVNYTYLWSNKATTSSILVTTAGTYYVTVTSGNGCTAVATVNITGSLLQTPTITASGSLNLCSGDSVLLTASSGYSYYVWSNQATTKSIVVKTAGSYYVNVMNSTNCSAHSSVVTVTVDQKPSVTIKASSTILCAGADTLTAIIGAGGTPNYTLKWSNGATTSSILVNASGTYYVTVTTAHGCSSSAYVVITGNGISTPMITASGSTKLCSGDSVVLTASSGYAYYFWSNQATTQSITVKSTGTFYVTVKNSAGCYAQSLAITVNVEQRPAVQISASNTSLCTGTVVTLSAYVSPANANYTYRWSNGATTQTISVTTAGTYSVVVTGTNGCSGASQSITITGGTMQTPVISANGSTTICANGSVTLSTASGYSSYQWSNGATTPSITVSAGGVYTVTVTNGGCSATSAGTTVTVQQPSVSVTPSGQVMFCGHGKLTASIVVPPAYNYTFQWNLNGTPISGATGSTYTPYNTGANAIQGTYSVTVTTSAGCSATSLNVYATIAPIPVARITPPSTLIICPGTALALIADSGMATTNYTYQWQLGGTNVSGATNQIYYATAAGTYTVIVTNNFGCSQTSAVVTLASCRSGNAIAVSEVMEVKVMPNPAREAFTFNISGTSDQNTSIRIFDLTGRKVEELLNVKAGTIKAGANLHSGIYFTEIVSGSQKQLLRIIKTE